MQEEINKQIEEIIAALEKARETSPGPFAVIAPPDTDKSILDAIRAKHGDIAIMGAGLPPIDSITSAMIRGVQRVDSFIIFDGYEPPERKSKDLIEMMHELELSCMKKTDPTKYMFTNTMDMPELYPSWKTDMKRLGNNRKQFRGRKRRRKQYGKQKHRR